MKARRTATSSSIFLSRRSGFQLSPNSVPGRFPSPAMENFRSKSYRDGRMQMDGGDRPAPTGMHDLRSYSYSSSHASSVQPPGPGPVQIKKGRNSGVGSASKSWSFSDPELQRKKRVASYKVYSVEGKMKGSLRKGFKWVKETCNQVVYGWR